MNPLFPKRYIKPRDPVEPCKNCGCRLSRVRFVSTNWFEKFAEGIMPDYAWERARSRCRNCGDEAKAEWRDRNGATA